MKRIILCLSLFAFFGSQAQQINPVPDYVFSNKMSVGRNAVTDTAAYFSIGPRYGAIRGMMPPMVTDTASMSATKRNGLLIFSIQKNKYLYWDSVGSKWAEMAGTAGSAITGSGVAGYMPEFTTATNLDTTRLYHSNGRFGIGTTSPANELDVVGNIRLGSSNAYQIGNDNKSFSITNRVTNVRALVIDTANSIFFGSLTTANGAGSTLNVDMQNSSVNVTNTLNVTDTATFTGRGLFNDRVGIGTSAPERLLHVNGTNGRIRVTGGNHGFEFDAGRTGFLSGGADIIHFYTSGNVRGVFQADGEFLLNTTTDAGAYALQVAGSIYNTTGAVLAASSGNVGIGVTPQSKLHVAGKITIDNTHSVGFKNATGGTDAAKIMLFSDNVMYYDNPDGDMSFRLSASYNERLRLTTAGELWLGFSSDQGSYQLQVNGAIYNNSTITTGAPTGGSIKPWRLGEAATVSPTSPNRTIRVEIDGTVYYIHAKTTND